MQYRLVTTRLRVQRGVGNPDLVVERPHKRTETGPVFLDEDNPTLVTFDDKCQVDVPGLLDLGAIEPWTPPRVKPEKGKEVKADGEGL